MGREPASGLSLRGVATGHRALQPAQNHRYQQEGQDGQDGAPLAERPAPLASPAPPARQAVAQIESCRRHQYRCQRNQRHQIACGMHPEDRHTHQRRQQGEPDGHGAATVVAAPPKGQSRQVDHQQDQKQWAQLSCGAAQQKAGATGAEGTQVAFGHVAALEGEIAPEGLKIQEHIGGGQQEHEQAAHSRQRPQPQASSPHPLGDGPGQGNDQQTGIVLGAGRQTDHHHRRGEAGWPAGILVGHQPLHRPDRQRGLQRIDMDEARSDQHDCRGGHDQRRGESRTEA